MPDPAAVVGRAPAVTATAILVDDHQVVLEGLSRTLERAGIEVVGTFVDPVEALAALRARPVDLLVVDLRLADSSGLTLVDSARRSSPSTKVAVLTSFPDRAAASAAIQAGVTGFLLKDTPVAELAQRLIGVASGTLVVDSRVADAVLSPHQGLLSAQERSILELVAEGLTNREIGARLHLSH